MKTWAAILAFLLSANFLIALLTFHLTLAGAVTGFGLLAASIVVLRGGDGRYLLVPLGMTLGLQLIPWQFLFDGTPISSVRGLVWFSVLGVAEFAVASAAIVLLLMSEKRANGPS